jgi:hypothetical protein
MKIAIATGPFLPIRPGPAGAVEKMWHGLVKQCAAQGHDVTVITRRWPVVEDRFAPSRIGNQMAAVYDSMLGGSRPSTAEI